MAPPSLASLAGFHLEDSFFLGMSAAANQLRLRCLFVLTLDHPSYSPATPGEQHCYRAGEILIEGLDVKAWQAPQTRPSVLTDPKGESDLGSIGLRVEADRYRLQTEWFDITFHAKSVAAVLNSDG